MDPRVWVATGSDDGLAKVWVYSDEHRDRNANIGQVECVASLFGHQAGITSMQWNLHEEGRNKDDLVSTQLLTSSKDQTLKVWKPIGKHGPTHQTIPEPVKPDVDDAGLAKQRALPAETNKHSDYINGACWRPDGPDKGKQILSCSDDGTAAIWDVKSGTLKHSLGSKSEGIGHSAAVSMATWSIDGGRILTCSQDQTCIIWSPKNGHHIKLLPSQPTKDRWKAHWGPIWSAHFSREGHEIVTASKDGSARLWDCNTGQCVNCLHDNKCADASKTSPDPATHSDVVFSACFNTFQGQGNQVLTCSMDGTAKLWDKRDKKVTLLIDQHHGAVWSAVFGNERSSGGRNILTTSHDMTAQVFDQRLAMPKNTLVGHTGILWQASFNEDDQYVVTCSEDRTARLWNLSTGERRPPSIRLMDPVYPHKQAVTCASFRPPVMADHRHH